MHWNSLRYCIGLPPEKWYEIADEEGFHCFLHRDGRVTFMTGKQPIGHVQLLEPKEGVHTLSFRQDAKQISVDGADSKVVLPLPDGAESGGGYFSLKQQGLRRQRGEQPLRILSVDLIHSGEHKPLSVAERRTSDSDEARLAARVAANRRTDRGRTPRVGEV